MDLKIQLKTRYLLAAMFVLLSPCSSLEGFGVNQHLLLTVKISLYFVHFSNSSYVF